MYIANDLAMEELGTCALSIVPHSTISHRPEAETMLDPEETMLDLREVSLLPPPGRVLLRFALGRFSRRASLASFLGLVEAFGR